MVALISACLLGGAARGEAVSLAKDGRILCRIVLAENAPELDRIAATELVDHLEMIVGARPEVTSEPGDGTNIFVGRTPAIEQMLGDVDWSNLGPDGIVMRTVDDDVVLTGGNPRGSMNATYTFLQDVLGCRWWAADAVSLPKKQTIDVPELNVVYRPPFELRDLRTQPFWRVDDTFPRRMRQNGRLVGYDTGDHTIGKLVPAEEHYLTHPEWFAYRPEGDDPKGRGSFDRYLRELQEKGPGEWYELAVRTRRLPQQACTTNPELQDAVVRAVLVKLETDYAVMRPPKVIWVTQNDVHLTCRCPRCAALSDREVTAAAGWVELGNKVAAATESRYPDVLVGIMAFDHTERWPEMLQLHQNVLVYIAPLNRNHRDDASKLGLTTENIRQWNRIAMNVFMWDYDTNFRNWVLPHPNYFALPASLRFYAEQGVRGVMVQGSYGNAGDMQPMRAWVTAQLMWNPQQDARALMQEFLEGYYGLAGPHLMNVIDLFHHAVHRDDDIDLGAYATDNKAWLTLPDLCTATRFLEQAERVVQHDPTLLSRLRPVRLGIDLCWLDRYDEWRKECARTGLPFLGPPDAAAFIDALAKNEKTELGVGSYREWADFTEYVERARERLAATTP